MSASFTVTPGMLVTMAYQNTPLRDLKFFDIFCVTPNTDISDLLAAEIPAAALLCKHSCGIVIHSKQCPIYGFSDYQILLVLTSMGVGWVFSYEIT